jgi:nucleoside-diphosphate-sugar epimerase
MSVVLVTGANGFLGSAIVAQLRAEGVAVRSSDLASCPTVDLPDYRPMDLTSDKPLGPLVAGVEYVVHAAALAHRSGRRQPSEDAFFAVNTKATERLAAAALAAGVGHFVFISSVEVYGKYGQGPMAETTACTPLTAYGRSKLEAEQSIARLAQGSSMLVTILRPTTLYGERDPGNVARLMRAIDRRRFVWVGSGRNRKDLVYRGDAARACALAARRSGGERAETYNLCSTPCTMREVVDGLAAALGRRVCRCRIPGSLALFGAAALSRVTRGRGPFGSLHAGLGRWLSDDVYDGTKFQEAFGFHGEMPIAEGLRREVAWYRESAGS